MAFASTVSGSGFVGIRRRKWGTYSNADGDSGGDIATGLRQIDTINIWTTSHVSSTPPKATASGGTLTLVTNNDVDGGWEVTGL